MPTINITYPDGTVKQFEQNVTGKQIAESISKRLAEEALAVEVNGDIWDLSRAIPNDASLKILKWDSDGGKFAYWHSSAHLMAEAIQSLFPQAKFTIGPPIENGFYYDIDLGDYTLSPDDLLKIEKKMEELTKRDVPYIRSEISADDALAFYKNLGNEYKVELIEGLKTNGDAITFYKHGTFTDLCRGPHVPSTGKIKAIKLLSATGAYWRGDEKNKMLQRVYGITFPTKKELDEYLFQLEEAKRRDHRKLGKELDLFVFHEISPGAPFWLPKGMIIFRELEKFLRSELDKRGYQEINTPMLVKKDLWERSGHWAHYQENMFRLEADETIYSLKPMNCPESTYVYKHALRSYRDLPLRFSEIGRLHRNEVSGALGGLFRVRQITMDDAHIYCRPEQILEEITNLIELVEFFYSIFGLKPTYKLSTKPDGAMGDAKLWEQAEANLKQALVSNNIPFGVKEKDGAFYGPKIDIQIKDALNREWQVATIQLDFVMLPERFELEYVDIDGTRKRPVAIHRAIFGSFERFIGVLTEHFAGAFPTWLSPVQVAVLPITDSLNEYAKNVFQQLKENNVRVEFDERSEKIGYKIRDWEMKKVPYMLVVGEKEKQANAVSVRQHKKGDLGSQQLKEFITKINSEILEKKIS
ncbi:MAG: threonine--tRNA ligase [Ignavibacteriales bacterium]|nr:threonine--tRNA ligase [Ignavibacteriales bacterium]